MSPVINAIDFLYKEWNNKAAGLVGYGASGATSALDNLRLILSELQVATVRSQLSFSLHADFENFRDFKPKPHHETAIQTILDQVVAWSGALKALRA